MSSPDPDRLRYAQIAGAAARHAQGWRLTADEEAAAVGELAEVAAGRADLLAERAGTALGFGEGRPDAGRYQQIAELCIAAGADQAMIERWIQVGRERAAAAAAIPYTGLPPGGLMLLARARGPLGHRHAASSAGASDRRCRDAGVPDLLAGLIVITCGSGFVLRPGQSLTALAAEILSVSVAYAVYTPWSLIRAARQEPLLISADLVGRWIGMAAVLPLEHSRAAERRGLYPAVGASPLPASDLRHYRQMWGHRPGRALSVAAR